MNDMTFHLSFILDKDGKNGIDLISFKSLKELDNYISANFKNTNDVRRKYDQDIGEFCLNNMEFIKRENKKNNRNWTGSIVIIAERNKKDNNDYFHKIAVIYKNDNKMISLRECVKKIREKMMNSDILKKIRQDKRFLLSQNEKDLLRKNDNCIDNYYLKMAIDFFVNRIKRNDEWSYYARRSLMELCELNVKEIKTKHGIIKIVNDIPLETELIEFEPNVHFTEMMNQRNDEELYGTYDLDEIEKYR